MKPRNDFLGNLKRAQEAKQPAPESKPISEMTEAEIQAEADRLRAELRRTEEEEIRLGREELARRRTTLSTVLRSKLRRRPWKASLAATKPRPNDT
jgi:hypothetical protein